MSPTKKVTLGPPRPNLAQKAFVFSSEDAAAILRPLHGINPKLLILTAVAVLFLFFSLVYDNSPQQLTPLQAKLKSEKVMEQEVAHLKSEHRLDASDLNSTMKVIEKQILVVSRAEARGDRESARQELRKLIMLDANHASSPLYKFCVTRIKEGE